MFKSDYVAIAIAVSFAIIGGIIASAPIIDPGYVHPLALVLTGLGAALMGTMMAGAVIATNMMDRGVARGYASGREHESLGLAYPRH